MGTLRNMEKHLSRIVVFALWFYVASYPISIYFKTVVPFLATTILLAISLTIGTFCVSGNKGIL